MSQKNQERVIFSNNDLNQLDHRFRAKLINSLPGMKPTNLIGTTDCKGQTNLAIVSSVVHLGANPSLVGFFNRPDSVSRHTLENIRETKYYTINQVHKEFLASSHQTSARYPKEVSEFDACQIGSEKIEDFLAPFVKHSPIKYGVKFFREIVISENGTHFIIGEIEKIILPKTCLESDGNISYSELSSIANSGLDTYYETKLIGRLTYAKPGKEPEFF